MLSFRVGGKRALSPCDDGDGELYIEINIMANYLFDCCESCKVFQSFAVMKTKAIV